MKLRAVHLEGFRGATRRVVVKFDVAKSICVLFGENGTGKSSVVDAVDFACNQTFGSLDGKSLGSEKTHNHVGALTNGPKVVPTVQLDFDHGEIVGRLVKGQVVVVETPAGISRPSVSILRRAQISKLIDAVPKERFDALRSFFFTPHWTVAETALRQAHKSKGDALNQQSTRSEQATNSLKTLWQQQGSPEGEAERWAAILLSKPANDAVGVAVKSLDDALSVFARGCRQSVTSNIQKEDAEVAVMVATEAAKKAEEANAGSSLDLVQLLTQAIAYLESHDIGGLCPVCTNKKDAEILRAELSHRIAGYADLSTANSVIEQNKETVRTRNATVSASRNTLTQAVEGLLSAAKNISALAELGRSASNLAEKITAATISIEDVEKELDALSGTLQPLRNESLAAEQAKSLRQSVQHQVDEIASAKAKAEDLEAVTKRLHGWLCAVEDARKEVIDAELAAMSSEVGALYAKIHPDEGVFAFNFSMKASAISSLDFDADFHGHKSKPVQAYFSESHLDTLGLCVFLAVSQRKARSQPVILILDDVLTSVDAAHLERVMELIDEVALLMSQVFIATHYRMWRDKYRWAKAPLSSTEVIEFGPWSLGTGIQVHAFQDALAELQTLVKSSKIDRQAVASKGGIVLESMLDYLTLKYACFLPRNARAEFTLGALADGIDRKLSNVLKAEYLDSKSGATTSHELKPLISATTSLQWVRNATGCHFSALDSHVPDGEVRQFGDAVLALAQAIICPDCRTMSTKDKTGSNWQCQCGALKLWPLARPKD